MLSGFLVKLGWNYNASEATVFNGDLGFLIGAILEVGPEPRVDITKNIYSCCGDEIIPVPLYCYVG
jgi:hypothetical protein